MEDNAKALVKYIGTLTDFQIVDPSYPYNHMGATITDAMLQAGINYEAVVKPRVNCVYGYYEAKTTSGLFLGNPVCANVIGIRKYLKRL